MDFFNNIGNTFKNAGNAFADQLLSTLGSSGKIGFRIPDLVSIEDVGNTILGGLKDAGDKTLGGLKDAGLTLLGGLSKPKKQITAGTDNSQYSQQQPETDYSGVIIIGAIGAVILFMR
jgi:hypothetical protein